MAHARWHIENLIFKRLNALVNHKRYRAAISKSWETLLRIWMIGLTLLEAYLFEQGWHKFETNVGDDEENLAGGRRADALFPAPALHLNAGAAFRPFGSSRSHSRFGLED